MPLSAESPYLLKAHGVCHHSPQPGRCSLPAAVPETSNRALKVLWHAQNYYVYLALTQNTNIQNLQSAAKLGLDVTDDSYTSAPGDCQYANSSATANGGRRLLDMDMGSSSPSG